MSLPATDNFNRAAGNLSGAGKNWTVTPNATDSNWNINIDGATVNGRRDGSGLPSAVYWNADSFPNSQYSQVKISTVGSGGTFYQGVAVRIATGAASFYCVTVLDSNTVLDKMVSGVQTNISSVATGFANGDILRLEVVGTVLTVKKNGVAILTGTDATLTGGSAGLTST